VVKAGETLWSISRQYGVAVGDIASLNKLKPRAKLRAGQQLTIPVRTAEGKPTPTAAVNSRGDVATVSGGTGANQP
jgi:LysM repeat protein